MATEVEQRSTNSGHGVGHEMDMDKDTLLSRAERRPLTLSRRRILYQAPEFIQRLSGEDTVVEGSTVQFECSFKGFPKPTVTWFKDDVSLEFTNRISLESFEEGSFALVIKDSVRSDEATYQCRIENSEGSCSSTIYLSVKGSSRSPKRKKSLSPNRRMVSYPSFFPTIEEKIVEEEKEEEEVSKQEPSPLTQLYDDNKLRSRHTWPKFVGDWAFADDENGGPCPRDDDDLGGPFYACGSNDDDDVFTENIPAETLTHPVVHTTASSSACQQNPPPSHTNNQTQGDANNPSHSTFSRTVQQADDSLSSCTITTCSSDHYTTNSYNQSAVDMTSLPTESSDRSQSDHYQPITANRRRRHCSVDDTDEEDLSTIGAYQSDNITRARDTVSAASSGDGQPAVVKKKSPPPKGQRKRPPRKTVNHIGGVLATSFLLSSFTFCALCIDTSPEIFVIVVFVAAFMFQVIQQLNAM